MYRKRLRQRLIAVNHCRADAVRRPSRRCVSPLGSFEELPHVKDLSNSG
jgi:hypothetical protein